MVIFKFSLLTIWVLLSCEPSWARSRKSTRAHPRHRVHRRIAQYVAPHKSVARTHPEPLESPLQKLSFTTLPSPAGVPIGKLSDSPRQVSVNSLAGHKCSAKDRDPLVCLTCNVFFEANLEQSRGKLKVAQATKTRVFDKNYPATVCGVVWQFHQFSWTWQKVDKRLPSDPNALSEAFTAAKQGLSGETPREDRVDNYWNDNQVHPKWAQTNLCRRTKRVVESHSFCQAYPYTQRSASAVASAEGEFWDQFSPGSAQSSVTQPSTALAYENEAGSAQ